LCSTYSIAVSFGISSNHRRSPFSESKAQGFVISSPIANRCSVSHSIVIASLVIVAPSVVVSVKAIFGSKAF
jgi:hypothetical protein